MGKLAKNFVNAVDHISEFTGKLAGWVFFAVGFFVMFEVMMRYLLTSPTVWVDEVSSILQVWATFLAVAFVLKHRKHITIDIAFRDEHSVWRKCVETFSLVVILFYCVVTIKFGWDIWLKSTLAGHTTDSYLAIPKVYVQSSIWVGFSLLALQAIAELVRLWSKELMPDQQARSH